MRSLNRIMLMGYLASDVELRQTKNGINVVNFPVAINRVIRSENGEKGEAVDFHRVVVWGKLAEICHQYLGRGVAVYVEGRLINRSFDDKEGNRHFRTEIVADNVNFLTWKKAKDGKKEVSLEPMGGCEESELEEEILEKEKCIA